MLEFSWGPFMFHMLPTWPGGAGCQCLASGASELDLGFLYFTHAPGLASEGLELFTWLPRLVCSPTILCALNAGSVCLLGFRMAGDGKLFIPLSVPWEWHLRQGRPPSCLKSKPRAGFPFLEMWLQWSWWKMSLCGSREPKFRRNYGKYVCEPELEDHLWWAPLAIS